jgi:hypothetical protein
MCTHSTPPHSTPLTRSLAPLPLRGRGSRPVSTELAHVIRFLEKENNNRRTEGRTMFSFQTWLRIDIFVVLFQILQLAFFPSNFEESTFLQAPLEPNNTSTLLLHDLYWAWIAALFAWVMALHFVSSLPHEHSIRFAPYLSIVTLVQLSLTFHYRWNGRWSSLFTHTNEVMLILWFLIYFYFSVINRKRNHRMNKLRERINEKHI